ncbi:MAG: excinuclease ABC subunit A [Bacteroidetes bacterium GWF2_33_16]|nr:MAG: excinuclease ABC subunit A [Bacteroidetes bacterium GWE2_32_14]OFY02442.1 MAG: excinuclease ABC subunit A [Bacteroidetes bacterium GWF2_33_16]
MVSEQTSEVTVLGARVHNLKNIDVTIPRNKLVVITGLSGSGKSSLAFDTIYAEGQRRYIETLSAYARQFLGNMERPDVDQITGLSPVISIEQKTTNKNPRSTVGTVTEIYDFLRLLFARASDAYSHSTGEKMVKYTDDQIIQLIIEKFNEKNIFILAPVVQGRKGHYKELFEQIRKKGFIYARINGEIKELVHGLKLDRYKTHFVETVIDKLKVSEKDITRLKRTVQTAMDHGKGILMVMEKDKGEIKYFSRKLMCPTTGISYNEPAPHTFSFNSPQGACPTCSGLGTVSEIDVKKIIPDTNISIKNGGILPLGKYKNILIFWQLEAIAAKYKFTLDSPIKDIPETALNIILYGSDESFKLINTPLGMSSNYFLNFEGIINYIGNYQTDSSSEEGKNWTDQYVKKVTCPECKGTRLKKESLFFKIADKNISELSEMDIDLLYQWFSNIEPQLTDKQKLIARDVIKEIRERLSFLLDVGLNYLSLNRTSRSLSGGESQRIRLATQVGSKLVNVLYILDEPSIGLHQRDNQKLINSLKQLRDTGNSVIVVEHDKEMILSADYIVDMGPKAGRHGGKVVAAGTPNEILKSSTLTSDYLNHRKSIEVPKERRKGNGKSIIIKGARGHNLKNITVEFPLGLFICITGVSGSGKSSLINETLHPILSKHFYRSNASPLEFESIEGLKNIDKVIEVDQSPLGRTPRSNPATYTGVFTDIRKLFEQTPESKIRGYKAGRFSFNVKGGRCETCQGAGLQTIEMNFLPDVYVHCKDCNGKRYNRETLEVKFKGKSISDVLDMTINQSLEFFQQVPSIKQKIKALQEVGLGYITLGQASTTLSGGESQRVKLATELAKRSTGNTLYILDEPTTGLHFEDTRILLIVLNSLVDKGNSIIVIEHNMDVIKMADYIIDMGKEGGRNGGEVLCTGTPEDICLNKQSYTSPFLVKELL